MSVFHGAGYIFRAGKCEVGGRTLTTDIQRIADILGGPVFFWGLVVSGFSLAVLGAGAYAFLRVVTSATPAAR